MPIATKTARVVNPKTGRSHMVVAGDNYPGDDWRLKVVPWAFDEPAPTPTTATRPKPKAKAKKPAAKK